VVLKGVSLARILHANAAARSVTDIDVGIRAADVARAAGVLHRMGWEVGRPDVLLRHAPFLRAADEHTAEVACTRQRAGQNLLVELHWKLLPLGESAVWSALHTYRPQDGGPPVRSLAPEFYLLYLCAHLSGHGWRGLRWLCDVADFLLHFAAGMNAGLFQRLVREAGLRQRVGITLELLDAYFGIRWADAQSLRNAPTPRRAVCYLPRPCQMSSPQGLGATHRERMRLLDSPQDRLRYIWWLAHPTHVEWLRDADNGAAGETLRSRSAAWLVRAWRLAHLAARQAWAAEK
jgi:hypothetical protein